MAGGSVFHRIDTDELKAANGTSLAKIDYGFDNNGNLTSKQAVNLGQAGTVDNTYTYDAANRLKTWQRNSGTPTAYEYDKAGNRTKAGGNEFWYDQRNRLDHDLFADYGYTPRGTLATRDDGAQILDTQSDAYGQAITQEYNGGTQTYSYDALGRAVITGHRYSGLGNDLAADTTAQYIRDPAGALVGARSGATAQYTWTDLHTDVVAQYEATGTAVAGSRSYDPYGIPDPIVGSVIGNLGYQSEWTDPSTKRVNMHARWYDPKTGQFDSRDTVANSPVPNSANANRYAYANDNPLTGTDPSGHQRDAHDDGAGGCKEIGVCYFQMQQRIQDNKDKKDREDEIRLNNLLPACQRPGMTKMVGCTKYQEPCPRQADSKENYLKNCTYYRTYADGNTSFNGGPAIKVDPNDASEIAQQIDQLAEAFGGYGQSNDPLARAVITALVIDAAINGAQNTKTALAEKGEALACEKDWKCRNSGTLTTLATVATAIGCVALGVATAGLGAVACAVAAGAATSVASEWMNHRLDSWSDVLNAAALGGASGLLSAVTGGVGGAVAGLIARPVLARLTTNLITRALGGALVGGLSSAIGDYLATGHIDPLSVAFGALGGAFTGGRAKAACSKHSFAPDTEVLMADGSSKPISEVEIGDEVSATDPESGLTTGQAVTAVHNNQDTDLTDVSVSVADAQQAGDENHVGASTALLHTTQHHPFWDATDQAWVNAADLKPGHKLVAPDGKTRQVVAVRNFTGNREMRDLTVDNFHTYYVVAGDAQVLVHNCGEGNVSDEVMNDHILPRHDAGHPDAGKWTEKSKFEDWVKPSHIRNWARLAMSKPMERMNIGTGNAHQHVLQIKSRHPIGYDKDGNDLFSIEVWVRNGEVESVHPN
ncbi:RHS repeat-associated protein [Allocatelliglobosispora scoriae]|uniref:RHS repeat-associated protein n=1 Tax=Allocatelliglobosispora scoriae TaxID=643052 RepID=A0A841BNF8_9ACTN|nr:polymorphic toxin-type HINT domain-containing protein [Allocatelliglobosispora scoriae]MBB5868340.1 RHS repeat-associated protein [Allocatelliglobosispora scoriae]